MHCFRKVKDDLIFIGANDRRLALFEHAYPLPYGVSYNSYLLLDEKTAIFDCVDKSVSEVFFSNIEYLLKGKSPDYLIVQHMEPDHSATLDDFIRRYPDTKIVCNAKTLAMIKQYFGFDADSRSIVVKEGDALSTGRHNLSFYMAPMVHWPEVMVTYDATDKILFSADAFGIFGSMDGALFADEVDFEKDYMDEARRYYTNIVGKYGPQTLALLNKAASLDIRIICPLHGFVWRKDLDIFIDKYQKWGSYTPEAKGALILVGSVYGNTENAADILASRLSEAGVKVAVRDVSKTHFSFILSDAFKYSHIVFACSTYNNGIFTNMENLVHDFVAHNLQNRKVSYIQNGSWVPASAKLIAEQMQELKNMETLGEVFTIKSSLKEEQLPELYALADAIAKDINNSL